MSVRAANEECLKRIQQGTATLVDIRLAGDVVPGLEGKSVYHAGPPVAWDRMCGPMRGAIIGACLFEGWARTPEEAVALAEADKLRFDSCHNNRAIGPMAGIITPSMQVHVVRNEAFDIADGFGDRPGRLERSAYSESFSAIEDMVDSLRPPAQSVGLDTPMIDLSL